MPVVVDLDLNSSVADNSFEAGKNVDICARGMNIENAILIRSTSSKKTKKKGNDIHILGSKSRNVRYYRFKNTTCLKRRLFSLNTRRSDKNCDAKINSGPSRNRKHVGGGSEVGHGVQNSGKRMETAIHVEISCSKRSRLASNEEVNRRMIRCSSGRSLFTRKQNPGWKNSDFDNERINQSFTKKKMVEVGTSRIHKTQTYNRYIQKKLSPNFFSKMLSELSEEQRSWVENTGFGTVLPFRMKRYAHKLGYTLVEAFDRNECSIILQDGNIKITDAVVEMVLGLPRGAKTVDVRECKQLLCAWECQFGEKPYSKVTATMIAKQIRSHGSATFMFNFLVLLSNFLVESNNNGYVKTDIIGFCGDIEKCLNYNWCGFVIDKLLTTHEFWARNPSTRHFTWSLPLLTYLYLDRVSNVRTQHVERSQPAYIAWTYELIKAEEKYIIKSNCFGEECVGLGEDDICITRNTADIREDNILGQGSHVQGSENDISERVPSLLDDNLEELLDDQKFMKRFDSKLDSLDLLCKECMADHGTTLAMYPDHPKTTVMKEKLAKIFETQFNIFEHTTQRLETPLMSKYQCSDIYQEVLTPWSTQFVEVLDEMGKNVSEDKNKHSFCIYAHDEFPSFNLNLTPSQDPVVEEKMIEHEACEAKIILGGKQQKNMVAGRSYRMKKLAATMKSPYITRVHPIKAPALNSEGHAVWEWLFDNRKCMNQILFKWKNTGCGKKHLHTLMSGEWVEGNVIDTWTHILNQRESRRSESSPHRLFCTIDSTLGPLTTNYLSELDRCVLFYDNMDLVLQRANSLQNTNYREQILTCIFSQFIRTDIIISFPTI